MRSDLDRSVLTGRARRLAEFAIKATLMRGRTRVIIPNRAELCRLLKIGKNHVAEVVQELDGAAVIQFTEVADGWELLIFPDSNGWRVQWIYLRHELDTFLSDLERCAGQAQGELLEAEPRLAPLLAEVSAENTAAGCGSQNGNHAVPKMGTRPLTVNSEHVHSVTAIKQLSSEQLTREDEAEAMDLLRSFVGDEDVKLWGGDWRKNWLRRHPRAFTAALRTLIEESRSGWAPRRSRGAALKDLTRRYADER
jgi:hypothetical protein